MNKDKILAKSRKEYKNNDEREVQIKAKPMTFSYMVNLN